jgi:hypothetical protein
VIATPVRGRDAEARLARALHSSAHAAGLAIELADVRARPWASATFVGIQVSLVVSSPRSPTLGRWLSDLPLAELPMRDHLLASLALDRIEDNGTVVLTTITALVIEN